jgi:flagellar motor switch protein FliN
MSDGNIGQEEIDDILSSLTAGMDEEAPAPATASKPAGGKGGKPQKSREALDTENIPLLMDVKMKLSVVLGNSRRSIRDVLDLGKGSIVELDRFAGEDVDVYINDQMIGKGQIVALDDEYGIKITRIYKSLKKVKMEK